jgi:hypothetical protein
MKKGGIAIKRTCTIKMLKEAIPVGLKDNPITEKISIFIINIP